MSSTSSQVSVVDITSSPGSSDSPTDTRTAPRRLFYRLRTGIQSLASIQTALPEYTETASIRSFRPESTRSSIAPTLWNPNRDSAISRLPPGYPAEFATPLNEYEFKIRPNNPWVTLKVHTLASTTPGHKPPRPHFTHNDSVSGIVELNLDSPQVVRRITLSVVGRIITSSSSEGILDFLDHSVVVWAKEDGDPRSVPAQPAESTKAFDGKLQGSYKMPFSFPFPTQRTQDMPSSPAGVIPFHQERNSTSSPPSNKHKLGSPATARLLGTTDVPFPPTFQEHGNDATIEYALRLQVVQGRFKPDSTINAPFKYILATTPPRMPESRRMAYEVRGQVPGPLADPHAWVKLPPARILGQMLLSDHVLPKRVSMECTLYLAAPLAYLRGTMISCHLTLQGEDETCLHALSSPKSLYIRLTRRLTYFCTHKALDLTTAVPRMAVVSSGPSLALTSGRGPEEVVKECAVATWWVPPKDVPQERTVRRLEGEIHLPRDLHPTCPSNILKIEYFVELLPPIALGFAPFSGICSEAPSRGSVSHPDPMMEVLVSQPVDIVTLPAAGDPIPIPFTGHRQERARRQAGSVDSPSPREGDLEAMYGVMKYP